jgi:hydrogenase maturation protease
MRASAASTNQRRRLLVLGMGNTLCSDDGVGAVAARQLRLLPRAGVLVAEIGTAILDAIPLLEWAERALVIDAMQAGGRPGTIYWAKHEALCCRSKSRTAHDRDLSVALDLLPRQVAGPELYVLGVEPESIEIGLGLSSTVRQALPAVLTIANGILRDWREEQKHQPF